MRLFIAVNFSRETKNRLLALRDELRARSERGRFSLPENLHLTLGFLGECDPTQTAGIKTAMDAAPFAAFDLTVDRVGRFRRDGGDIWWAGVKGSKPLLDLQRELTNTLIAAGFGLEKRHYDPHVTLGREVVTDTAPWPTEPFGETVSRIDLMKSERINGKLTYTAVYTKKAELS
ncbi:MAG: RNA 2',3'-cyclic phosphodiesterase [Oscillospiraceae bacterium]|jgi:2'-5' RNA ligase|nr:RNA 2',3'-cyclic phosphodiesterase [Oscillospiraceae bacterium]